MIRLHSALFLSSKFRVRCGSRCFNVILKLPSAHITVYRSFFCCVSLCHDVYDYTYFYASLFGHECLRRWFSGLTTSSSSRQSSSFLGNLNVFSEVRLGLFQYLRAMGLQSSKWITQIKGERVFGRHRRVTFCFTGSQDEWSGRSVSDGRIGNCELNTARTFLLS